MRKSNPLHHTILACVAGTAWIFTPLVQAGGPVPTTESRNYLLIGRGPEVDFGGQSGVGPAVTISGYEIGANKAPVPSTGNFLTNGSSGGPTLINNVQDIPLNAVPVFSGISADGNVAVTHSLGKFNFQGTGVYGDVGIRTALPAAIADDGTSDSFYNDPQGFPNTFTSTGFTNPGLNNNTGGFGSFVSPSSADQATRIDGGGAGITGNVNFTALNAELATARAIIAALPSTGTLVIPGGIIAQNTTLTLAPGLNVIDIIASGGDLLLSNSNLVIDGPAGATAIFRMPDDGNFLASNGNMLIGTGGIALDSVMFFSDRGDNATHFSFNNAVINGVAFWSLGASGGQISVTNAQGRTQLIADKITLNQVRLSRSAFVAQPCNPCDVNCDASVNGIDIQQFANVLSGGSVCSNCAGDTNNNGSINGSDVQGFVECLLE